MNEDNTVQSIFNEWFVHFRQPSLQQYTNLYHSTVAIVKYFEDSKDSKKAKNKLDELEELFFTPIEFLNRKYEKLNITKNPIDWDISKIEWCYYRDTKFRSKLSVEYFVDSNKEMQTRKITLGGIITILSLFKLHLFKTMVEILIEKKLDIKILLPTNTGIDISEKDVV